MVMEMLFDTNIIIAFLKNEVPIVDFFRKQECINVSSISVGEMYYGALNSKNPQKNYNLYKDFFEYCNILKIDEITANYYAKIRLHLKNIGNPIPENDIWIAATVFEHSLTIVTRDKHLLGLELINTIKI